MTKKVQGKKFVLLYTCTRIRALLYEYVVQVKKKLGSIASKEGMFLTQMLLPSLRLAKNYNRVKLFMEEYSYFNVVLTGHFVNFGPSLQTI